MSKRTASMAETMALVRTEREIRTEEARIEELAKRRRLRESPAAATTAELVWNLITGANDQIGGVESLTSGMTEFDKLMHYISLRRTNKAAAERYAAMTGITLIKIKYWVHDPSAPAFYRVVPVTPVIMESIIAHESDGQRVVVDPSTPAHQYIASFIEGYMSPYIRDSTQYYEEPATVYIPVPTGVRPFTLVHLRDSRGSIAGGYRIEVGNDRTNAN